MRAIELFAGVGGFRVGLEKAGHTVVWSNEWDKYACDVYDYNFKDNDHAITRGDITKIDAADIPAHDLIVGGFPCQAFSVAGKRRGFDETRGTLFFDIMRIATHHRTPYLFLENVKGLLNHDGGKTFATILRTLDECGYDVQWQVLNSKNFGVPQNRERIIIIGHLRGRSRPEVFPLFGNDGQAGADLKALTSTGVSVANRVYDPSGSAMTLSALGGGTGAKTGLYAIPEATVQGYAIATVGDSINLQQPGSKTRRGRVGKGVANTLDTSQFQHTIDPASYRIRRLTPRECERLQAFPDDWTAKGRKEDGSVYEVSDTQRYKMCGNAVTTNVIQAVASRLPV